MKNISDFSITLILFSFYSNIVSIMLRLIEHLLSDLWACRFFIYYSASCSLNTTKYKLKQITYLLNGQVTHYNFKFIMK